MSTDKTTQATPKQPTKKAPAKPRAKQIKLTHIKQQQKAVNKMEMFVLDEEQNLQIKYYPIFSETKIQELLVEAYADLKYSEDLKLDFFTDDNQFIQYVYFLIIRRFTSLESEIPEDFESKINIMSQIIEIGLFNRIFDEVLNQSEVYRILERLQEFVKLTTQIGELSQKELSKLDGKIQNPEILQPIHPLVNPHEASDLDDSNG